MMEEKMMESFQIVMGMLENSGLPMEEEEQLRSLIQEKENRRAEIRIAYDLLALLQKEARQEPSPGRMPGNQYGPDICNGFGVSLYQARLKAGITQQQLSDLTGINQADISRLERGFSNPSLATIKRLADGLGKNLNIGFV